MFWFDWNNRIGWRHSNDKIIATVWDSTAVQICDSAVAIFAISRIVLYWAEPSFDEIVSHQLIQCEHQIIHFNHRISKFPSKIVTQRNCFDSCPSIRHQFGKFRAKIDKKKCLERLRNFPNFIVASCRSYKFLWFVSAKSLSCQNEKHEATYVRWLHLLRETLFQW